MKKLVYLAALSFMACANSHIEPEPETLVPPPAGSATSALIGPAGGEIDLGTMTISFPSGAVAEEVMVSARYEDSGPDWIRAYAPELVLEPAGLELSSPVTVSLPFEGAAQDATIYAVENGTYFALDTSFAEGRASAELNVLGRVLVGTACLDDCCGRGQSELDVLLMVDNSNSMADEQAALAEQLPRLVRAIATGDLDGDGVQDSPAARSLQMGVISSDLGVGDNAIATCDRETGDSARLLSQGASGCELAGGPIAQYLEGDDADAFSTNVSCVAMQGVNGCGFEQQLEAIVQGLSDESSTLEFTSPPAGMGPNAGLVRENSVLSVIALTDEDDCSARDNELYNMNSSTFPGSLNLRCWQYPEALHPVSRYVEGLRSLRPDGRLSFSVIGGMPEDTDGLSPAEILADPAMVERQNPDEPQQLYPACTGTSGMAFPARRLLETAQELQDLGATVSAHSICSEDYTPAIRGILRNVSRSLGGSCG